MRIAILHSGNQGFFPRFYIFLRDAIVKRGDEVQLFSPKTGLNLSNKLPDQIEYGSRFNWITHYNLYRITGVQDVFSVFSTLDLIRRLNQYKPDVIHMHIVNAWVLNFPLFVNFVNKRGIQVVWTHHDCRAFTGRCPHFEDVGCFKWKENCGKCPLKDYYWPSWVDSTSLELKLRRRYLYKFKKVHMVTPSKWLLGYLKESCLGHFPSVCLYNGVDIAKFSTKQEGTFIDDNIIRKKKIILGIAMNMDRLKGLDYFIRLSHDLSEDYQIVLIGGVNENDKARVPKEIIVLPRTKSVDELALAYQSASVFVNPTLIDNFPTVNIESLASGTPVVTFNTGGSAESIDDYSGVSVPKGDYTKLLKAVTHVSNHREDIYTVENCRERAQEFSLRQFEKYVDMYHSLT